MGGHYPTSRGYRSGFERRTGGTLVRVPGGIAIAPRNRPTRGFFPGLELPAKPDWPWGTPPDFPRSGELDPQYGKQPWDRRGMRKGQFWPQTKRKPPVFGRLGRPIVTQQRFPRFPRIPWGWAAAGLLPFIPWSPTVQPRYPGMIQCFDIGAPKDSHGFSVNVCLPSLAGVAGQVMTPGIPMVIPKQWGSILIGWMNQPEINRGVWKEQWRRGGLPDNTPIIIVPYDVPEVVPWKPLDPAVWLPLDPQPYNPNFPRPVWGRPVVPQTGYPRAVAGNSPPSQVVATYPAPPVNIPDVWISSTGARNVPQFHQRTLRKNEHKYRITGPFAGVALALLTAASKVYNGITEAVDLLAAIYSAIPAEIIARHPDNLTDAQKIPFMLEQIWLHRYEIDYGEALTNIVKNAIEDAVWGRYFGAIDRVRKSGVNHAGYERQLGDLNDIFQSLYGGT